MRLPQNTVVTHSLTFKRHASFRMYESKLRCITSSCSSQLVIDKEAMRPPYNAVSVSFDILAEACAVPVAN